MQEVDIFIFRSLKGHRSEFVKILFLLAQHRLAQMNTLFIVYPGDKTVFIL